MTVSGSTVRPLHYVELQPGPGACDVALAYWGFTVHALPYPGFLHRLWPDGSAVVVAVFAGGEPRATRVVGARTRVQETEVTPGSHFWGVRMRPEAGPAWLGVPAPALRDANIDAVEILGEGARTFARDPSLLVPGSDERSHDEVIRHLDRWILTRGAGVDRMPSVDPVARDAVQAIVASHGMLAIATLAARLDVTARTLQRRFREATGLTPKEFAGMRRGRAALKRVVNGESRREAGGWSALADAAGFADQAHLTRELARLTRLPPRALREWLDTIEHGGLVD